MAGSVPLASGQSLHDVANVGTRTWSTAARTGRADTLILGDSVVWVNSHGWDYGLNDAMNQTFGLAGTGLTGDSGTNGQGYGFGTINGKYGNGWTQDIASVPVAQQGYVLRAGVPESTVTYPNSHFGFSVNGLTLDPGAAYDWHLYTAGGPGGGATVAFRRYAVAEAPYSFKITDYKRDGVPMPQRDAGLNDTTFHFAANSVNVPQEFLLDWSQNMSVLYSRLITPDAHGTTVSSLGLGGNDTHQFFDTVLNSMSSAGRATYLANLVAGSDSGKLNIVIAEGLNDRNNAQLSINGLAPDNTPEALPITWAQSFRCCETIGPPTGLAQAICRSRWWACTRTAANLLLATGRCTPSRRSKWPWPRPTRRSLSSTFTTTRPPSSLPTRWATRSTACIPPPPARWLTARSLPT